MLEEQLRIRQKDLDAESGGMDGMIRKEYVTGERAGIMLALKMPHMQLSGIEEEIDELKQMLENDDETE